MNALTTFLLHHLNKPCLPKNPATLVNMLPIFDILRGAWRHSSSVRARASTSRSILHRSSRSRPSSVMMQQCPLLCHHSTDQGSDNEYKDSSDEKRLK